MGNETAREKYLREKNEIEQQKHGDAAKSETAETDNTNKPKAPRKPRAPKS